MKRNIEIIEKIIELGKRKFPTSSGNYGFSVLEMAKYINANQPSLNECISGVRVPTITTQNKIKSMLKEKGDIDEHGNFVENKPPVQKALPILTIQQAEDLLSKPAQTHKTYLTELLACKDLTLSQQKELTNQQKLLTEKESELRENEQLITALTFEMERLKTELEAYKTNLQKNNC